MNPENIRNIAIIAHIDVGKTSLAESFLYTSGNSSLPGLVEDGTTAFDFLREERERKITIKSACQTFHWHKEQINLIDTPGHIDFSSEVEHSLRVLDGAVLLLDCKAGVEAQTEKVWELAEQQELPMLFFINKLDKIANSNINVEELLLNIIDSYQKPLLPLTLPYYDIVSGKLVGVLDLITSTLQIDTRASTKQETSFVSPATSSSSSSYFKIPEDCREFFNTWKNYLLDMLIDIYIEDSENYHSKYEELLRDNPSEEIIRDFISLLTENNKIFPLFCGSALNHIGIVSLLNGIVSYIPNSERIKVKYINNYRNNLLNCLDLHSDEEFFGLVFKLSFIKLNDNKKKLVFLRILQGSLSVNAEVYTQNKDKAERVVRLHRVYADKLEEISHAGRGDIVVVEGLVNPSASSLLAASSFFAQSNSSFDASSFLLSLAIEPVLNKDRDALLASLDCLLQEDPSLLLKKSEGLLLLRGRGELHLQVAVNFLTGNSGVGVNCGKPMVASRSKLLKGSSFFASSGDGDGLSVEVELELFKCLKKGRVQDVSLFENAGKESLIADWDNLIEFDFSVNNFLYEDFNSSYQHSAFEKDAIKLIKGSCFEFLNVNILDQFCSSVCVGVRVKRVCFKGGYEPVLLRAAVYRSISGAYSRSDVKIKDPYYRLYVSFPVVFSKGILADLRERRARLFSVVENGDLLLVKAFVMVKRLLGYVDVYRSLSRGRGDIKYEFAGYYFRKKI